VQKAILFSFLLAQRRIPAYSPGSQSRTFCRRDPAAAQQVICHILKEDVSMDSTTIVRIVAGVLFVIFVTIIVVRRKNMAAKRKRLP
jgi:hypothetical protein